MTKIIEAVGRGKIHLPKPVMRPRIAKVRVVKKRDGKVYEDLTIEYPHGINR